jgi:hypothetical protein
MAVAAQVGNDHMHRIGTDVYRGKPHDSGMAKKLPTIS